MSMEWLHTGFAIRQPNVITRHARLPPADRDEWRAVCGLVADIWGLAPAVEANGKRGKVWSVFHLPTGLGVGSFDTWQQGAAYVERIRTLAPWDAVGGTVAIAPALRAQIQQVRRELGGV